MAATENAIKTAALIGTGMVAKTHLAALSDLKGRVRLTGVLSRQITNAEIFAQDAGRVMQHDIAVYPTLDDLMRSAPDFAIILTPPNARADIVQSLAAAGIHILMEKPVARTTQDATALVKICEEAGVALGIVFQHRVRAASRALTDLIAGGALGKMHLAEACVPWWRDQSYYDEPGRGTYERDGGGVLISQAIHTLDLLLSLTGPVKEVQAMARTTALHQMESEDYVSAGLQFANGAVGSVIASTASFPGAAELITLHFEHAVAILKSGRLSLHFRDGRTEMIGADTQTGGGADPMAFTSDWHRDVIADFADALSLRRPPLVTGREALKVHTLIDAIMASSNQKCVVELPT